MPHMWGDWTHPLCSVLLIPLESCRGQGEGSALGKVGNITGGGRERPCIALRRFPTISCRAFPTQSGARQNEGARGSESCPLLVSTYDCKHSFAIPSNCILPDKLLLLSPPMFYLSASSIHWFCDREEKIFSKVQ